MDASGTSRAGFYDGVQVGDSFDFRTYGLDCGFRFEVTSVSPGRSPRTFGVQRVGRFGERCSQIVDQPDAPRDVHFVWGIRPAIKGSGRVLVLPYGDPVGPGTYRLDGRARCVFEVPPAMQVILEGVRHRSPARRLSARRGPQRRTARRRRHGIAARQSIAERCRETGRRITSPEVDALFDQIAGSMRHEHATSTDLPGGRCGDPSDPACTWVVHRGTPDDHPWVWQMPASAMILPDARGRYQVARGETVTVRNLAYRPIGYTRFSLQTRSQGILSPASSQRPVPRDVRSYTFTVAADEEAPNLFTYDVTAARPGEDTGAR